MLDRACAHCRRFLAAATRRCLGRVSVPVWLIVLTDQRPVIGLVGAYPANHLMGRTPLPGRSKAFLTPSGMSVRGISTPFGALFPSGGQVRTCSSAVRHWTAEAAPCDLHALGTPPALILSQDQTRHKDGEADWRSRFTNCVALRVERRVRRTLHTSVGKVRATKKRGVNRRGSNLTVMLPVVDVCPEGRDVSLLTKEKYSTMTVDCQGRI